MAMLRRIGWALLLVAMYITLLIFVSVADAQTPIIIAPNGTYLGNLNSNPYDPNSVSNPYGPYGNRYSPNSINNPYGQYGNPYSPNSVNNPYATGPRIVTPRR